MNKITTNSNKLSSIPQAYQQQQTQLNLAHKTINPTHLKHFLSKNPFNQTLSPLHQPRFEQGENPNQQKS